MPCYSPLKGYRSKEASKNGKYKVVFNSRNGYVDKRVDIPCGQCIGCRLERSRQWAIRCINEASLYERNCFITLTYNDEYLPEDGSLKLEHFQNFMKRLRKEYQDQKIRFFHCGEYGEKLGRPHYHSIIFNLDFDDVEEYNLFGSIRKSSKKLRVLWPYGFNTVGDVTFESASYVARYITKKVTGDKALEHYDSFDKKTGEIFKERRPEYTTMSRRPGIGCDWIKKYKNDVYPSDEVIVRGIPSKPPKYYDSKIEETDPELIKRIKLLRSNLSEKQLLDNDSERLVVKENVRKAKLNLFSKRRFENE